MFLGATASQPRLQDRQNEANIQYTHRQKAILWSAFSQTTHPKPDEREFLAQQMGLPAKTGARLVQNWFQNRRNNLISSTTQPSGTYFILQIKLVRLKLMKYCNILITNIADMLYIVLTYICL